MEDLKVRITGDTEGLTNAFTDAQKAFDSLAKKSNGLQKDLADNVKILGGYENELQSLQAQLSKGTITQDKFAKSVSRLKRDEAETTIETKKLKRELSDLNGKQKILTNSFPKLSRAQNKASLATGNSTATLGEFSRVIQDAPFGIQGVGNNITQLVTQFQFLSTKVGGTGAAIKSLLKSFLGPAGILVAVSLVISILTFFADELFNSAEATNKLAKASAEFVGSAKAEIITLQSLLKVAKDESLSKKVRAEALERINKKYGKYLGNLKLEELNTKEVANAVNALSLSLVKQAQVRGANKLIEEEANDRAEEALELKDREVKANKAAQTAINNLIVTNAKFQSIDTDLSIAEQFKAITDLATGASKSTGNLGKDFDNLTKGLARNSTNLNIAKSVVDEFESAQKAVKKFNQESADALAPIQAILNSLTLEDIELAVTVEDFKDLGGVGDVGDVALDKKDLKEIEDEYNKLIQELDKLEEIWDLEEVQGQAAEVNKIFEESGARIREALKPDEEDPFSFGVDKAYFELLEYEKILDRIKSKLSPENFKIAEGLGNNELKDLEQNILITEEIAKASTAAIGDVFQNLSGSLSKSTDESSSGLERFASSLASSVLQVLSIYLSQSIGAAIAGGSAAGAATGPAAPVAIPTLIASLSASVIGAFAAIPSFAQGGIVPGGSFVGDRIPALLNSGEMVLNTGQQKNLFNSFNKSGSGSEAGSVGNLTLDAVLKGDDIYLSSRRAEKRSKRFS